MHWKKISQYNVDGEPGEGEEDDDDEDEFDDALFVLDALGGGAAPRLLRRNEEIRPWGSAGIERDIERP